MRGWEAFSFFVGNTAMLRCAPEWSETQMLISGNLVKKKREKKEKEKKGIVNTMGVNICNKDQRRARRQ